LSGRLWEGLRRVGDDAHACELCDFDQIRQFIEQRDYRSPSGNCGGWQRALRAARAELVLDGGARLAEWPSIVAVVKTRTRARQGHQLELLPVVPLFIDATVFG
jgi:hypothetical protein